MGVSEKLLGIETLIEFIKISSNKIQDWNIGYCTVNLGYGATQTTTG
jgi:hypothetical protein